MICENCKNKSICKYISSVINLFEKIKDYHEYALEELEVLITIKFDCKMYVGESGLNITTVAPDWYDMNKNAQDGIVLLDYNNSSGIKKYSRF